ncbi:MAG: hypothetical protein GX825_00845 [Syntrophomonadaceae bacterium]|nr:hypothetical protein [Syntrophomonadaceae bacterium]
MKLISCSTLLKGKHIGLYPGGEATAVFAERLAGYKTSKGTIQLLLDKQIDYELIGCSLTNKHVKRFRV